MYIRKRTVDENSPRKQIVSRRQGLVSDPSSPSGTRVRFSFTFPLSIHQAQQHAAQRFRAKRWTGADVDRALCTYLFLRRVSIDRFFALVHRAFLFIEISDMFEKICEKFFGRIFSF